MQLQTSNDRWGAWRRERYALTQSPATGVWAASINGITPREANRNDAIEFVYDPATSVASVTYAWVPAGRYDATVQTSDLAKYTIASVEGAQRFWALALDMDMNLLATWSDLVAIAAEVN